MATIAPAGDWQAVLAHKPHSLWADALRRLARNKAAVTGMTLILFFVFVALFADRLAPHPPLTLYPNSSYLPAAWIKQSATNKTGSAEFLLGTDGIGRDVLSRLIYGARVSMVTGLAPIAIILIVGTTIGMISGYVGGWVDNIIMRITDIFYAFPDLLLYIILMATLRDTLLGSWFGGLFLLFIALALVSWVDVARLVRGSVLSAREKEYVEAARSVGARPGRIMLRHILPNIISPLVVMAAFSIPRMIIVEAVLGYLGLGLRPTTDPNAYFIASWGSLMLEGQSAISAQPWLLLSPALCVAAVVLSFTFLGDGLRDALDPRMSH